MRKELLHIGFLSVLCLVVVGLTVGSTYAAPNLAEPGGKKNMQLVGYNDVQGRETLQVSVLRQGSRQFAFIGHHNRNENYQIIHHNPLTNRLEENGTTILDISDPSNPTVVVHIPNFNFEGDEMENRNSRSASVVYNFRGSNRDFLVRNSEGAEDYFEVFEITDITRDGGTEWVKLGNLQYTASCGEGCGGELTEAHKGYLSPSGFYYGTPNEPGFKDQHLVVWDLRDLPSIDPGDWNQELGLARFVGRGWIAGQKVGDDLSSRGMHHPTVDEANSRVYGAFLSGGDVAAFDINFYEGMPHPNPGINKRFPTAWKIDTSPPYRGTHTISVIRYDEVPNFGESALPRFYALVTDEAGGGDIVPCTNGVRTKAYMMDVTDADKFDDPPGTGIPFPVETWEVPVGDFCEKGGRFGPHQHDETRNGAVNEFGDRIAFFAYFNAGVRAVDISDPYNLKEVGYYIPKANANTTGVTFSQHLAGYRVIQINDVDTDENGLVYATDRVGSGFYILRYTP